MQSLQWIGSTKYYFVVDHIDSDKAHANVNISDSEIRYNNKALNKYDDIKIYKYLIGFSLNTLSTEDEY